MPRETWPRGWRVPPQLNWLPMVKALHKYHTAGATLAYKKQTCPSLGPKIFHHGEPRLARRCHDYIHSFLADSRHRHPRVRVRQLVRIKLNCFASRRLPFARSCAIAGSLTKAQGQHLTLASTASSPTRDTVTYVS
eukprot:7002411-Prymnesium_polylepis.1